MPLFIVLWLLWPVYTSSARPASDDQALAQEAPANALLEADSAQENPSWHKAPANALLDEKPPSNALLEVKSLPDNARDPLPVPESPGCDGKPVLEDALQDLEVDCNAALKIFTYFDFCESKLKSRILKLFTGPERIPLTGKEARRANAIFDAINRQKPNGKFDNQSEQDIFAVFTLFDGNTATLSPVECQYMKDVIEIFNGGEKADEEELPDWMSRMVKWLKYFDSTGLGHFHFREVEELYTVLLFFAGKDHHLQPQELENMEQLTKWFSSQQKKLRTEDSWWLFQILQLFDSNTDGALEIEEQKKLVEVVGYFSMDLDTALTDYACDIVMQICLLIASEDAVISTAEADDLLIILKAFSIESDGKVHKLEATEMLQFMKMFAGDGNTLMLKERQLLLDTINWFRNSEHNKPLASAQVLKRMTAELSLFDANDDKFLDPDEQVFFMNIAIRFGARSPGFGKLHHGTNRLEDMSENFKKMQKAISEFRGKDEGLRLSKVAAHRMVSLLDYFVQIKHDDERGLEDTGLDAEHQQSFVEIAHYFGKKKASSHETSEMSSEHMVAMDKFLRHFMSTTDDLQLTPQSLSWIKETLKLMDDENREQRLRDGEGDTLALATVEYFASPVSEKAVNDISYPKMEKVLKWFANGNILRKPTHPDEKVQVLILHNFLELFGNNVNRTLDPDSQDIAVKVVAWLQGLHDAEKSIRWLLKIMPHFAHEKNRLKKDEFENLQAVVNTFEADKPDVIESEEVQDVMENVIKLFAGDDSVLTKEETAVLTDAITFFHLQVGVGAEITKHLRLSLRWLSQFLPLFSSRNHEITPAQFEIVKKVCEAFETNRSKIVESDDRNALMMAALKKMAGPDQVLEEAKQRSITNATEYFMLNKKDGERYVEIFWGAVKWFVSILPYFEDQRGWITVRQLEIILNIFEEFDADVSKTFDEEKQHVLGTAIRYFAGGDQNLGADEAKRMIEVVNLYLHDTPRDIELPQERDNFLHIMRKFDGDGSKGEKMSDFLNEKEQKHFLEVSRFFASKAEGSDVARLSNEATPNLLTLIRLFEGKEDRLALFNENEMLKFLELFDADDSKSVTKEEWETAELVAQYFAGVERSITIKAYDRMVRLIDYFNGEENKLVQNASNEMLSYLESFDMDSSRTLDDIEASNALEAAKAFAGPDGNLNEQKRQYLLLAMSLFAGQDGKLDAAETKEFLETLKLFSDFNGTIDIREQQYAVEVIHQLSNWATTTQLQQIRTTIAAFAGGDKRLTAQEAEEDLLNLLQYFDESNNAVLPLTSLERFKTVRDYFLGGNEWFEFTDTHDKNSEKNSVKNMQKVVKHYAQCEASSKITYPSESALLQASQREVAASTDRGRARPRDDSSDEDEADDAPTKGKSGHVNKKSDEEDEAELPKLRHNCYKTMISRLQYTDRDHVGIIDLFEQKEILRYIEGDNREEIQSDE